MVLSKEEKIMKAILYTRVSTKEQMEGYSLSYQEKLCKEYATKQDWEVLEVFQEEGESAKTADRTQFQKMLDYCSRNKGKIDIVLVHKIDRFSRNSADHHSVRAILARYGVVLRSVSENINESSQGKFMESIYSAVAQYDNDVRAERVREGLKEKVRQGYWAWIAPIGYTNTPNGLAIDKETAPYIRKAFEAYAQGNRTVRDLARLFNKWGIRNKKGGKLCPQSVIKILQNKLYIGIISIKDWGEEVDGVHEKIIEPKLFYKVQNIRHGRCLTTAPRLFKNPEFPLKNVGKCNNCKKFLAGSKSKGRNKRYAYYHCFCGNTRIRKEEFEDRFLSFLKKIAPNTEFKKLFRAVLVDVWKQKQSTMLNDLKKIDQELARIKDLKSKLIQKNLSGIISDEDYKEQSELLSGKLATKELERSEIRHEETDIDYLVSLSEELFSKVSTIWLEASFENKLRFQHLLFPEGITYESGEIRTARLGLPFNLIDAFTSNKTTVVSDQGLEP